MYFTVHDQSARDARGRRLLKTAARCGSLSVNQLRQGGHLSEQPRENDECLAAYGVTAHAVCPSYFRTNLTASMRGSDPDVAAKIGAMVEESPITAEEIAAAVLAGMDAGEDVIVPDEPAQLAVTMKRHHRAAYDAEMRRTATRMKERAESS